MKTPICHITLVFLMIWAFPAYSQHITWGEDPRKNSSNHYFMTVGENADGIFVLSHSSRKGDLTRFAIERYSHNLFFQNKKAIRLRNQTLERIQVLKNNVFFATSPAKRGIGQQHVYGCLLNKELGEYTKQLSLLSMQIDSRSQDFFFRLKNSPDYENIGVFGFRDRVDKTGKTVFYSFYDAQLNKVYTKTFELDFSFSKEDVSDIFVDNLGNLYMAINKINKQKKAGEGRFETELIYYNHKQDYFARTPITDPQFRVPEMTFSFDESLELVFANGFFGQEINTYQTGVFQIGINTHSGAIRVNTFTAIPLSFVGDVVGEKYLNQGVLLNRFFIKKFVRTADGKGILIAERFFSDLYQDQFWTNGVPVNITRRMYHYDEILLICLDTLGEISWNKVIKKKQTSEEDNGYFSSVLIGVTPNFISLIYNDRMGGAKDVLQYLVSADGEVEMKVLLPAENFYTFVIPVEGRQVGYNRLVVPVTRQRDYSLIKITYTP